MKRAHKLFIAFQLIHFRIKIFLWHFKQSHRRSTRCRKKDVFTAVTTVEDDVTRFITFYVHNINCNPTQSINYRIAENKALFIDY